MNVNEIIINYYFAIQHSHYRNHLQKYYRFNFKNEWKNTLTTREHGLGELQDQATSVLLVFVVRVGHIIQARVLAEERSDLFVLLVCERLWEFRASFVFIGTVCRFLTCRRFICYTSPGRRWLSLLVSRVFPVLGFCFFPGGIFYGKNMNIPNYVLCCHLGVCESCELLHQSPGFYMLWGIQSENQRIPARSSVAIARSSDGASRMTARESPDGRQAWVLYRHRRISVRWPDDIVRSSHGDCRISVRWPADFFRYISDGGPPIAARWSDGVPRGAAGWGKVGRNRPIIRQILTAS